MEKNINLFPNPPSYFKSFVTVNFMLPPDINCLNKINSFMSFGVDYKMKELNTFSYSVESLFLNHYDENLVKSKNIPNQNIFLNNTLNTLNMDNLNINIFDAIKEEITFIRSQYNEVIEKLIIVEEFELSSCLIKFSFQKIYFFISLLKNKKVL
jgi:hypothetical protein